MITRSYLTDLTYKINGAAIEVHKELGPGLLESIYRDCMVYELISRGLKVESEKSIAVNYKGNFMDTKLRCDLLVENTICVELKAIEDFAPIHEAQLLTYMKLLKCPKGILYNFHVKNLYNEGQKTLVNEYFSQLND
jgi:GxxExxY protein